MGCNKQVTGAKKMPGKALDAARLKSVRSGCPCCNGEGEFCCDTWRSVVLQCGVKTWGSDERSDLQVMGPLWPMPPFENLEMSYCPFCGKKWGVWPAHLRKPGEED